MEISGKEWQSSRNADVIHGQHETYQAKRDSRHGELDVSHEQLDKWNAHFCE